MRNFSQSILSLLSSDNISVFYCVHLTLGSTQLYHVNLPYDVTIPGLGTFLADNNLLSIEAPKLSTVVDRETYKITYLDVDFDFKPIFAAGAVGSPVSVYIGFFNTSESTLGGAAPGRPMLQREDIILAYRGIVDTHGYVIDQDEQPTCGIECSSPMASLDLKKVFNTSRNSMRSIAPSDSSFDQVYEGSAQSNLLWGKQ